jgi:hypothetical protein
MQAGGSLLLVAIGAILYWAVTYRVSGVNVPMIGLILMVVGVIGVLFALLSGAVRRHRTL